MTFDEKKFYYTKEHEWLRVEDDYAYVGITNHAQGELGDIIFIEFPEVGDSFDVMDVFGTIEAVKTVADLFCPIKCKIVEINTNLENNPEKVNSSPFNEGWLIKVKLLNNNDLKELLDYSTYNELINNE